MVDFKKLKSQKAKPVSTDPLEIFRRLPKPEGVNDLYTSQTDILQSWFKSYKNNSDTVIKLHTGGGKTLIGLLIAQSTLIELGEPVLYLAPTKQLVEQTIQKAREFGIHAVPYVSGAELNADFLNSRAIMVSTYNALFNGRSKFGIRGQMNPISLGGIILDDAHSAFSVIRDSFTLKIDSITNRSLFESLIDIFRKDFRDIDKLGTLEDIVLGRNSAILEVPFYAWNEQLDTVREQLRTDISSYEFVWPILRDNLHLCHALISKNTITITPILPQVNMFPSFEDAKRKIYMSATISDDSDMLRTFDSSFESLKTPLKSRSLAGISERMILIPDLMPFTSLDDFNQKLVNWAAKTKKLGSVVLVPSEKAAEPWKEVAELSIGSNVEKAVKDLQELSTFGPIVFANRYDGIDLPGDSCRLLVMEGLPRGTSDYEIYKASTLYKGNTIIKGLAQRIEQGIGRGARGAGDHCVILLLGKDIASWISKDANFKFLTSATQAQLEMGIEVSKEIKSSKDLVDTIERSFSRDADWVEYHADSLAELVENKETDILQLELAKVERKALNLWNDGHHDKAINKIERLIEQQHKALDSQTLGWLQQFAARIADHWGNKDKSLELQRSAYSNNRNLTRPKVIPPYKSLPIPMPQADRIAQKIQKYKIRRGYLQHFEKIVSDLHPDSSANRFEEALKELALSIGLVAERLDERGEGPDVLWLLPEKVGLVIEAKSRKLKKNELTKTEHGQLLVAGEWFTRNYPEYECIRTSIHPQNFANKAAYAEDSYALTFEKLSALITDARILITSLVESHLEEDSFIAFCNECLAKSNVRSDKLVQNYLTTFIVRS